MRSGRIRGTACVKCGPRDLGAIDYKVEVSSGGQASIVQFDRRPPVKDGDQLHLTLEDGRMLDCYVLNGSSYCSVVGEGPYYDRRRSRR